MSNYIKEYTTSKGRYFEVVEGKLVMDSIAAILWRVSISLGIVSVLFYVVVLILNIDAGIFDLSGKGAISLIGIGIYSFVTTALGSYIGLLIGLPIYIILFRGKWSEKFRFKV